jgi:hypothetical protein
VAEDFFTQETRMARAALTSLLQQTRERINQHTDIRPLIRRRPWSSLLAAFSGGMVSGYLLTPRPRSAAEKAARKEEKKKAAQAHPHRTAAESIQEHLIASLTPAIGAFASAAAAALFHHRETHGDGHRTAPVQEALRDVNPLGEP